MYRLKRADQPLKLQKQSFTTLSLALQSYMCLKSHLHFACLARGLIKTTSCSSDEELCLRKAKPPLLHLEYSINKQAIMSGKGAKGLSGKGAKGTMGDKGKAGDKKKPVSRSARAGLQFPVGRIHRLLKVGRGPARNQDKQTRVLPV